MGKSNIMIYEKFQELVLNISSIYLRFSPQNTLAEGFTRLSRTPATPVDFFSIIEYLFQPFCTHLCPIKNTVKYF